MAANLGTILIWVSWLYVAVAVIVAKTTYRKARQANPSYFSVSEGKGPDPFKVGEARGTFELIMDDAIDRRGFDASVIKRVRAVKVMYLTAPIALIAFVVGIMIR
jgi:hypothetical protein